MRRAQRLQICTTASLIMLGCREPTQITVEITTDIDCADVPRTGISVGTLADLETRPIATQTVACDPVTGRIGSLVIVPGGEKDAEVAVRVVTGITKTAEACVETKYRGGCVVARRALAFRSAESLYLPIEMEASCIDVPCGATQTCKQGVCVSATIEDPSRCGEPSGCDVSVTTNRGGSGGRGGADAIGGQLVAGGTTAVTARGGAGGIALGGTGATGAGGQRGGAGGFAGSAYWGGAGHGIVEVTGGVSAAGVTSVIEGGAAGTQPNGGATSAGGTQQSGGVAGSTANGSGGSPATAGNAGAGGETFRTVVVNTVNDVLDGMVSSIAALRADPGADAVISLREALLACNNTPNAAGPDVVRFDIPGVGPHVIAVGSNPLPRVTDPIVVDGQSEPNFVSAPVVELDGTTLAAGTSTESGLSLVAGSDGSSILGLAIHGFPGSGLAIDRAGGHTIRNCYFGLRANGTKHGNAKHGVLVLNSADNTIGGSRLSIPRHGNVASGNSQAGIMLTGAGTHHNLVFGNIAGLDPTAKALRRNNTNGVFIDAGAHDIMVGGASVEFGNVLSGNWMNGLRIADATTFGNVVQNNYIGTDAEFSSLGTLGNAYAGIRIVGGAHDNLIGGATAARGNWLRFNSSSAIVVDGANPLNNAILGNRIYDNGELAIDLGSDGVVNVNDQGDVDVGPNDLLNYPEFVRASYASGEVSIDYVLDVPAGTYRVEFFVSGAAHRSGYGNGEQLAHVELIQHGGSGEEPFDVGFTCDVSAYVTATVTEMLSADSYGSTSEFSMAVPTTF